MGSKDKGLRTYLLARPTGSQPESLSDLMFVMAANIEDSILESSNAIPGKDYTVLDLYKLAQPFALSVFKNSPGSVYFDISWPDYKKQVDEDMF